MALILPHRATLYTHNFNLFPKRYGYTEYYITGSPIFFFFLTLELIKEMCKNRSKHFILCVLLTADICANNKLSIHSTIQLCVPLSPQKFYAFCPVFFKSVQYQSRFFLLANCLSYRSIKSLLYHSIFWFLF